MRRQRDEDNHLKVLKHFYITPVKRMFNIYIRLHLKHIVNLYR